MKHAITCLLLLVSLTASPQKTYRALGWKLSKDISRNEVKLNLGTTIAGLYPEITYERILSEDFSLGVAAGASLNDEYPLDFGLMPYARWFFGGSSQNLQKYGAGFFIEANAGLFSKENYWMEYEDNTFTSGSENKVGGGIGLAVGWKYISKNQWVGEIYVGGGRDFVNDGGYPRLGLSIGKRF